MQRAASLVVVRFDEDCCVFPWLRANNVAEQLRASTSGAKAQAFSGLYGTAEAVPFQSWSTKIADRFTFTTDSRSTFTAHPGSPSR